MKETNELVIKTVKSILKSYTKRILSLVTLTAILYQLSTIKNKYY